MASCSCGGVSIHSDAIVLATPEIAGLPYVIAGLVAAGGLAAALSTADGLLLAIANALSHDVYYQMIDPRHRHTPPDRRPRAAGRGRRRRRLLGFVPAGGDRGHGRLGLLACRGGLFVPLVLGIWWKRTTKAGACAGMIAASWPASSTWSVPSSSAWSCGSGAQHLLRPVRAAGGFRGHHRGQPDDQSAEQGDAGPGRFGPDPRGAMPELAAKAIQHDPAVR